MSAFCKSARSAYSCGAETITLASLLLSIGCSDAEPGAATSTASGGQLTAGAGGSAPSTGGTNGGAVASAGADPVVGGSLGGTESSGGSSGADANGGDTAGSGGNLAGNAGSGGGSTAPACTLTHAQGVTQLTLMSGGLQRKVRLFVPKTYDGATRLPLLLNLHGSSDNADNFAKSSQMEQVADNEGFVVAGLEAVAGQWNVPPADGAPDDVKYGSEAIDLVASQVCIDTARVYASGFSGGGRMSSRLGCLLPEKITAIGPVAGVRWPAPCTGRPLPVIAIHGLGDTTNAYAGEGPEHPRWNESVEEAVLGWATKDGCNPKPTVDDPPGPISVYSYGQCQGGVSVKLMRMDGVDHAYPTGTPLHAAREVWGFVKAFSMP
ncbi:MAG TPA: PHB depolymerase family esterase [Polyangiaceae bacterium]|nr:PHB depolymerase family esterase [Polyangiaceae bacterium]